jgi:hypothetical protein
MYPGGFSSVIDASKLFHMFLTVYEERKFMGLIHPDYHDVCWERYKYDHIRVSLA